MYIYVPNLIGKCLTLTTAGSFKPYTAMLFQKTYDKVTAGYVRLLCSLTAFGVAMERPALCVVLYFFRYLTHDD